MSTFNGKTKIDREVADPKTDHTLPSSRSLSWRAITTPAALAGTNSAQCELVHGDKWYEINGNHTENIAKNQTIKVVGKHKETLVESCYQNIIGPHIVLNNTVRNETLLGTHSRVYGDKQQSDDSTGTITQQAENITLVYLLTLEADLLKLEFEVMHFELKVLHDTIEVVSNEIKVTEEKEVGIEDNFAALANKVCALNNMVQAMNIDIGGLYTGIPVEIHGSPMLGPNQVL